MRYSNTELKGLRSPKEILIKNLSEYISLFSKGEFDNCIFRGEPTNYPNIISSALRRYSNSFADPKTEFPFIDMKDEFKREVFHKINESERENFLAFSQHHGLPTNLVDFTKSPLVSLYFACQPYYGKNENYDNSRGFVNVIKNKLIDVTDIIRNIGDKNLLYEFVHDKYIFTNIYFKLLEYENNFPYDFYKHFKQLNKEFNTYFFEGFITDNEYPKYYNGLYKNMIIKEYLNFINIADSEFIDAVKEKTNHIKIEVMSYCILLNRFLFKIPVHNQVIYWINSIPNFVYTPILSFERGINQQGLFIYQTFLSFKEEVYNSPICSIQRIWPDVIIVIENKEHILKELDFMGINQKFIYGDFDNIANYIKNKHT
ncbi:FRG domain-containing protein [Metaclostridioides mangenotii]|uniref:FRG domain-containing protein n=1 Tax=Metaclostridioides mangenotii TaxID=1540 RepID=UPI0028EDCF6A|nr:FRG domain-containing protein [Clostridioides mangenotii]